MKQLLLTGYDEAYAPLAELTVPLMEDLALRRGFDFRVVREPLIDVPFGIYWTGIVGTLKAFDEGYDQVIYFDVDQCITNPDYEFPEIFDFGFHASLDWGADAVEPWQFSACGFVANRDCIPFFERVLSLEPQWRDKPFPEQAVMQAVVKECAAGVRITTHPRRVFNSVPDAVCPGKVPEPWDESCWAAHLTMIPMESRIKLAKEILSCQHQTPTE